MYNWYESVNMSWLPKKTRWLHEQSGIWTCQLSTTQTTESWPSNTAHYIQNLYHHRQLLVILYKHSCTFSIFVSRLWPAFKSRSCLGWNQRTNRRLVWILWSDLHGSLVVLPKVEVQRIHQEMSSRLEDSKWFYLKHALADESCAIKESFCSKRHPFLKFRCLNNSATPPQTTWYSDFVWFSVFLFCGT